jgi:hypothetical protein
MQVAPRYTASNRRERRSFATIRALIIFHHAEPDTDPQERNPYVCGNCGHVRRLCTCTTMQTQASI